MSARYLVLVAYDIADPRRLQRVARALEEIGERVQKSVFECGVTPDGLIALRERLRALIDPREDRVLLLGATVPPLPPRHGLAGQAASHNHRSLLGDLNQPASLPRQPGGS